MHDKTLMQESRNLLSKEFLEVVCYADNLACATRSKLIYPVHLFGAILWLNSSQLRPLGLSFPDIKLKIEELFGATLSYKLDELSDRGTYFSINVPDFPESQRDGVEPAEMSSCLSSSSLNLLQQTTSVLDTAGTLIFYVNCSDLMELMLNNKYDDISQLLESLNISREWLNQQFNLSSVSEEESSKVGLEHLGFRLKSQENKWIIGRNEEVSRLIKVLSRQKKRNAILVGDPGVGKKSILELLARRIDSKQVPTDLQQTILWSMNTSALLTEAQFRGDFEQKTNALISQLEKNPNIVLCIEDIHSLLGVGSSEGGLSAGSLFKPALTKNTLRLIGTTTFSEYKTHLEKDPAFLRNFDIIFVKEPNKSQTREILVGVRDALENYHNVIIPNTTLDKCLELSSRYLTDRQFPDKAIDLLDSSCSEARLEAQRQINSQLLETENYVAQLLDNAKQTINMYLRRQEYELVVPWQKFEQFLLRQQTKDYYQLTQPPTVTSKHLANTLTLWSGVPTSEISTDEESKMRGLESNLQKRVMGQDRAVSIVADAVRRARMGFQNMNRPLASFFFAGPTGVGKTELAKALAETLFNSDTNLIRFDMSEFMEKHSTSRLIGSPPGYVGYGEGGQLTEAVRKQPYSIVLFDEIEKAHEDVSNIMLQILDDGRLTDSTGQKVDFTNTILVFTSNLGYPKNVKAESINEEKTYRYISGRVQAALEKYFRPEFLNRIDRMVVFNNLPAVELNAILGKYINELRQKLNYAKQPIILNVNSEAKELIVNAGYQPGYGARPLARALSRMVEIPLSNLLFKYSLKQPLVANFSTEKTTTNLVLTVNTLQPR